MKSKENLPYIDKPEILSAEFRRLYSKRISTKNSALTIKRKKLNFQEKTEVLKKTGHCCHICGQELSPENVQFDHILPQSTGGDSDIKNYIAVCTLCNSYRWNYLPEEIRWLMKVGVWVKTQIEFETHLGKNISELFIEYEKNREQRRKQPRQSLSLNTKDYPIRKIINYSSFLRKEK